jgi:hypothetical protein
MVTACSCSTSPNCCGARGGPGSRPRDGAGCGSGGLDAYDGTPVVDIKPYPDWEQGHLMGVTDSSSGMAGKDCRTAEIHRSGERLTPRWS